jgi:hypothetical protein
MRGKGSKKYSKSWFKVGHPDLRKTSICDDRSLDNSQPLDDVQPLHRRLTKAEFDGIVEFQESDGTCTVAIRNQAGIDIGGRILRSRISSGKEENMLLEDTNNMLKGGYRLVHQEMTRRLWNKAIKVHKNCVLEPGEGAEMGFVLDRGPHLLRMQV